MENRIGTFDCIRVIAALLVLYSHAFNALNLPVPFRLGENQWLSPGTLGVTIFFVTSGFLVTKSCLINGADVGNYAKSRLLRIFPALLFQYLVVIIILGMFESDLPFLEYCKQVAVIPHLALMPFSFYFPDLPGVFTHNIKPRVVNGNLWTLAYETSMYLALPAIVLSGRFLKINTLFLSTALYGTFLFFYEGFTPTSLHTMGLIHCWSFLLGSLLYLYHDRVPLNISAAICGISLWYVGKGTSLEVFTYTLSTAYLVIYMAFLPLRCNVHKFGDFSYGIYLYSFPVEQYFVTRLGHNFSAYLSASLATTIIFAALSWHLVEKRALAFKVRPSAR